MLSFSQFIINEAAISASLINFGGLNNKDNVRNARIHGWSVNNKTRIAHLKIGQQNVKDSRGEMGILWYKHPRMGVRIIDHPGTHTPITHATWMKQEGIKDPNEFDRLPRGRFHLKANGNVNEFLHSGKETPNSVYDKIGKIYKIGHKFFTPKHHIIKVDDRMNNWEPDENY
jgi:hypothetical protein